MSIKRKLAAIAAASKKGSYGTEAKATNPGYSSNGYHFICRGSVYNSDNANSGVAWDTKDKSIG